MEQIAQAAALCSEITVILAALAMLIMPMLPSTSPYM